MVSVQLVVQNLTMRIGEGEQIQLDIFSVKRQLNCYLNVSVIYRQLQSSFECSNFYRRIFG